MVLRLNFLNLTSGCLLFDQSSLSQTQVFQVYFTFLTPPDGKPGSGDNFPH